MSDTNDIESVDTLADRIHNESQSTTPSIHVLENIERDTHLRDTPTAILCPGCGDTIDHYETGLPAYLAHFTSGCIHCDVVPLERWSILAVDAAHTESFAIDSLASQLQHYWERNLWAGIEPSENVYRSQEFTHLYDDRAEAFGWDWRACCPLCRRPATNLNQSRLDYHHWQHNPDIGVCLCRTCHRAIHAGHKNGKLDDRARDLGLTNRYDLLIARLAAREAIVAHYESIDNLSHTLRERYNLPYHLETIACIIRQTFYNEDIRTTIDDCHLTKGLNGDH